MQNTPNAAHTNSSNLLSSTEIIDAMIELRVQLAELEQQIQALQPAFSAACLALNTDKIALERVSSFKMNWLFPYFGEAMAR